MSRARYHLWNLGPPFSVSVALTLAPVPSPPPFIPIVCAGGKLSTEPNDEWGEIKDNHFLRLGLCNRELRPLVQLRTSTGVHELVVNEILPSDYYAFDLNVEPHQMTLYANGRIAGQEQITGEIDCQKNPIRQFGFSLPIWICQVYRSLRTKDQINNLTIFIPFDLRDWTKCEYGYDRFEPPTEGADVAYTFLSNYTLGRHYRRMQIVDAILRATGRQLSDFPSYVAGSEAAGVTLSQVTSELERLVSEPDIDEPTLLAFFRDTRGATFLLEPYAVRQWREDGVPDYGQIDFVFERHDGIIRAIELEPPGAQMFLKTGEFAARTNHAIDQVTSWIRGITKAPNQIKNTFRGATEEAFQGSIVIGRQSQLDAPQKEERWRDLHKRVVCQTWDDVIEGGKLLARRLRDPNIEPLDWQ